MTEVSIGTRKVVRGHFYALTIPKKKNFIFPAQKKYTKRVSEASRAIAVSGFALSKAILWYIIYC